MLTPFQKLYTERTILCTIVKCAFVLGDRQASGSVSPLTSDLTVVIFSHSAQVVEPVSCACAVSLSDDKIWRLPNGGREI